MHAETKKDVPTQQPPPQRGSTDNGKRGQLERGGRNLHRWLGKSSNQTSTSHPPTKRCCCSHRTLVGHFEPCSHDRLHSHPSRRNQTKMLHISRASTPIPELERSPSANSAGPGPGFLALVSMCWPKQHFEPGTVAQKKCRPKTKKSVGT